MKKVPEFKSEAEEFEFWSTADSTEYTDWSQAKRVKFINLKPTLRTISVRLPVAMVEDLKILANQRDVPYQSLLKVFLAERLERERSARRRRVSANGVNAMIGVLGRCFEIKRAVEPVSVKTAINLIGASSAAWQINSATVSATVPAMSWTAAS